MKIVSIPVPSFTIEASEGDWRRVLDDLKEHADECGLYEASEKLRDVLAAHFGKAK